MWTSNPDMRDRLYGYPVLELLGTNTSDAGDMIYFLLEATFMGHDELLGEKVGDPGGEGRRWGRR